MDTFITIFLIALLIIPALWLASIVWGIAMYTIVFLFSAIVTGISWVFGGKWND